MVQTAFFVSTENISDQEVVDHIRMLKKGLFCIAKQNSYVVDSPDGDATNWVSQQTRELDWLEDADIQKMVALLKGDPKFLLSIDYDDRESSWFLTIDLFLHFSKKWNFILTTEYDDFITRQDVIRDPMKYKLWEFRS